MDKKSLLYLWKQRTLFIGEIGFPIDLQQGAATLCVSLGNPFRVYLPSQHLRFEATSVLIPPGVSVNLDTLKQPVANLNLDVMGDDFNALRKVMSPKNELYVDFQLEHAFKAKFSYIYQNECTIQETRTIMANLCALLDRRDFKCDARVRKVVDLIQNSIEENLSIEYLADQVKLSVPGLTKLFKKTTGVPIRRYRQWHRLFITATEMGKGKSLTDAALIAGFVDLPHCTHTFNTMLGMKPSYFLMRPNAIRLMVESPTMASSDLLKTSKTTALSM